MKTFTPGALGFDQETAGFQTAYTHRPSLVVAAENAEDVRQAVALATDRGLDVAVQATGHGLSVPTRGGVLITTSRMAGKVRIDVEAKAATISAGTRWGAVVEAAARHGLAPVNGSSPSVGVVGYLLGGGMGILGRKFGYAADHVRRIELVTADAQLHSLVPGDELFDAVLGTGGNFGIVAEVEIGLFDLPTVYGGQLVFDGHLVAPALKTWRQWTATVPDEMTSAVTLIPVPDIPAVPEAVRGRYLASIRVAFNGSREDGERLVEPLRAIGTAMTDDLRVMPYSESSAIHADPDNPHAYAATNAMLDELTPQAIDAILELTGPGSPIPSVVDIRHIGGAMRRPQRESAPSIDFRDADYIVRVISAYTPKATPDAVRDRQALLTDALAPWTLGRSLNFVYGDADSDASPVGPEQTREGYTPQTYDRLLTLKQKFDAGNMFRSNRNLGLTPSRAR